MIPPRVPILSLELQQLITDQLSPGEKQIWAGQPLPRLFRQQSFALVFFGVPWTAMATFWTYNAGRGLWGHHLAFSEILSLFFPLVGLGFVLIGVGFLSSPLWIGTLAKRTVYVLTDRRAILIMGKMFSSGSDVTAFDADRLTSIQHEELPDGSGDVYFQCGEPPPESTSTGNRKGFLAIENVRGVEALSRSTLITGYVKKPDDD